MKKKLYFLRSSSLDSVVDLHSFSQAESESREDNKKGANVLRGVEQKVIQSSRKFFKSLTSRRSFEIIKSFKHFKEFFSRRIKMKALITSIKLELIINDNNEKCATRLILKAK